MYRSFKKGHGAGKKGMALGEKGMARRYAKQARGNTIISLHLFYF